MTKPLVDKGIFRRVGDCPTPWPCFVIAVRSEVLEDNSEDIETLLSVVNQTTVGFKQIPDVDIQLSERYNQKAEDIRQWLSLTEWSQSNFTEPMLNKIQNQLSELGIIDKKGTFADIVHG